MFGLRAHIVITTCDFWCLPLWSCRRSSHPRSRTVDPLSHSGHASRPLVPNSVAQFSCGVIDIVESMLRRVLLSAVCAPPSESFFLNFYDVTLPIFGLILVWMCMSYMTTPIYPRLLFDYHITLHLFRHLDEIASLKYPC